MVSGRRGCGIIALPFFAPIPMTVHYTQHYYTIRYAKPPVISKNIKTDKGRGGLNV